MKKLELRLLNTMKCKARIAICTCNARITTSRSDPTDQIKHGGFQHFDFVSQTNFLCTLFY